MFKQILQPILSPVLSNVFGIDNPLQSLSMFSDLIIFEPRNATGANVTIPDTVGSAVTLSQNNALFKPTITGNYFNCGANNTDNKGLTTSTSITFKEVFIVTEYIASTFSGFATLLSGSGASGIRRIMGESATANMNVVSAVNIAGGRVSINNASNINTNVLPLPLSVLHTTPNYSTPTDIIDTFTVGYNSGTINRAWTGRVGAIVFSKIGLNSTQRLEIVNALKKYHGI